MDYRLGPAAPAAPVLLVTNVFPFAVIFLARGAARTLSGASVALITLVCANGERRKGLRRSSTPRCTPSA
jgi:hypothetical protein